MIDLQLSTGIPGLDRVFRGLISGDNLVWQFDAIEDFAPLVPPYCRAAKDAGRKLVYFRFADHPPLVPEALQPTVHTLHTSLGFEQFITEIHSGIRSAGRGAVFAFDCLSTLAEDWCSDRMLGNFFMLTCPYVYDMESLAYFPLLRNLHSLPRHRSDLPDDADPVGRLPAQGGVVHPSQQGRASLLADDVHAARLGGRQLPAGHGEFDDRRDPHVPALGRAGLVPLPPGQVEPDFPEGRARLGGDAARRAAGGRCRPSCSAPWCGWCSRGTSGC